jgi:hypothetical protein
MEFLYDISMKNLVFETTVGPEGFKQENVNLY